MLLLNITAQVTGVTVEELTGRSRMRHISEARYIACHILRENGYSLHAAGHVLNRHHTTVLHGCCQIEGHLKSSFFQSLEIQRKVYRIKRILQQTIQQSDAQLAAVSAIDRTMTRVEAVHG